MNIIYDITTTTTNVSRLWVGNLISSGWDL